MRGGNDSICAFCGKENDSDADGYFYLWTRPGMSFDEGEPACKACREGKPGRSHEELHGPGNGKR